MAKGRSICIRRPVPKDEMEALIWQRVQSRLAVDLEAGGEQRLAEMIAEEAGSGADPAEEAGKLTAHRGHAMGRERAQIEAALAECGGAPQTEPVDPRALAAELQACSGGLDEIRTGAPVEEQKIFLRGFIGRIEVDRRGGQALAWWKKSRLHPPQGRTETGCLLWW